MYKVIYNWCCLLLILLIKQSIQQITTDCDVTYKCFLQPANCVNTACTYIYKWKNNATSFTDFIIAANVGTTTNRWIAIGFSTDATMGTDNVVMCKSTNSVEHYWNSGQSSAILNNADPNVGLTSRSVTISGTWLICSFTREVSVATQTNYFDLSNQYYVLAAYGDLSSGTPGYHSARTPSSVTYSFYYPTSGTTQTTTTTTTVAAGSVDTSDCGKTKGCFLSPSNCAGSSCTYIYKYSADTNSTYFDLYAKVSTSSKAWLAIGFSKDTSMGDDGVCICSSSASDVEHRYNSGRSTPTRIDNSNPSIGLSNIIVTLSNGWLRCQFTRLKSYPSVSNYFDLNTQFYALAAYGSSTSKRAISTTLNQHTSRTSSSSLVNFNSIGISSESDALMKVKAHGCLMVIAWMFFASIGIIFARYYKFILPNVKLCKLDFWFVMHRPMMVSVPILSIIAFLVILAYNNWTWVNAASSATMFAHSIFGIFSIIFAIVQPFIALCRCDKDSPKRVIFNVVHRGIGLSAFLFSIVAIFLGTMTSALNLGNNGWGIILGWTIWLISMIIALEIIQLVYSTKSDTTEHEQPKKTDPTSESDTDNNNNNKRNTEQQKNKGDRIKEILLIAHVIVTIAFTFALVILIGVATSS